MAIKQIYKAHKNASCWKIREREAVEHLEEGEMQIGSNEENWT